MHCTTELRSDVDKLKSMCIIAISQKNTYISSVHVVLFIDQALSCCYVFTCSATRHVCHCRHSRYVIALPRVAVIYISRKHNMRLKTLTRLHKHTVRFSRAYRICQIGILSHFPAYCPFLMKRRYVPGHYFCRRVGGARSASKCGQTPRHRSIAQQRC
jgi:hypothetical protein